MIIGELCIDTSFEKRYYNQKNLYNFLGEKYKKFYFINCHYIYNKQKLNINNTFYKKKNIFFFNPKTISELNNFLIKNKIFLINNLSPKFQHFLLHFLVSKKNIFQVSFENIPILSNYKTENWDHVGFFTKISFLFRKRLSKLLYRVLIILRIINQIDIHYIARKDVFKRYIISNKKVFFFIKRYKGIEPTSVKLPLFLNNKKINNKFITFIDSNILHPDILKRGHSINNKMLKNYFLFLRTYLNNLRIKFNKPVVICLHPSSDYSLYKRELKGFKMYKHKTEKYILNSFLLLFHASSSIFNAILLKKKIISLRSDILGSYINARRAFYLRNIKLIEHNIDNNPKIVKKVLTNNLNKNIKNYYKFVNKFYYTEKNSLPIEQIIENKIKKLTKASLN